MGERKQKCPFQFVACDFQASDKETIQTHLSKSATKHLALICDAVQELSCGYQNFDILRQQKDAQLDAVENRLVRVENTDGSNFLWKITNYENQFHAARTGSKVTIYSPPFTVGRHGYKMVMLAGLYGDGKSRGKYMSVFVSILRGDYDAVLPWPFCHNVTLSLIDQSPNEQERRHIRCTVTPSLKIENKKFFGTPQNDRNSSFGAQNFVDLETLKQFNYIKDDAVFLRVDIDTACMNNV